MSRATASDDYCYRHPKRQSFVLCQRCARTICAECQTPGAVGFVCPECMKAQSRDQRTMRAQRPRSKPAWVASLTGPGVPVITYAIIALCVLVFIAQMVTGVAGGAVTGNILYAPFYSLPGHFEPWRMLTAVFAHAGFLHILLNMVTLWSFGTMLEPMLGRGRYIVLFLLSGLGGSLGVLYLAPIGQGVVGASGAIFGMAAAFLIIVHRLGGRTTGLIVLLAVNLVAGFFFGWAWQAHVGGLVVGGLIGLLFMETRERSRRGVQIGLLVALAVVLVALSFRYFVLA